MKKKKAKTNQRPYWRHFISIDIKTYYVTRRGNPTPVRGQKKPWRAKNFGAWREPPDTKWGTPPQSHICTQSQETETPEAVESKSLICQFFKFSTKTLRNLCKFLFSRSCTFCFEVSVCKLFPLGFDYHFPSFRLTFIFEEQSGLNFPISDFRTGTPATPRTPRPAFNRF